MEAGHVKVFKFKEQLPVLWPKDNIGGTDRYWWIYNVKKESKWFEGLGLSCLQPGQAEGFHRHTEEAEGPHENWYFIFEGFAELRTEFADYQLERFDAVFVPTNTAVQIRNAGSVPLWWGGLSTRGGHPLKVDWVKIPASEGRPGYLENYKKILAARRKLGLPT